MTRNSSPALSDVLSQLAQEGVAPTDWLATTAQVIDKARTKQPWYVRAMIGFSAWLAALMLTLFIASAAVFTSETAMLVVGLLIVTGASWLRRSSEHDFAVQMALAFCLAGEALTVGGFVGLNEALEPTLLFVIALQAILILVFPDSFHRFVSVAAIVVSIVALLFLHEQTVWVHAVLATLVLLWLWFVNQEAKLMQIGIADLTTPVEYGLLFSALGVLMLSTIYVLPDLVDKISFFPKPWIAALVLGAVLLFVQHRIFDELDGSALARILTGLLVVALIAAALKAPGLIMALVVWLVGVSRRNGLLISSAAIFFAVFLTAYFYGIEISLMTKSLVLCGLGLLLLCARFALKALTRGAPDA